MYLLLWKTKSALGSIGAAESGGCLDVSNLPHEVHKEQMYFHLKVIIGDVEAVSYIEFYL